ncbi:MAG: hypothetical protein DHS80DRAFT_22825 [Piptocephalis tieghemiana]|nr:MAG: hypothetical protein DHS80DRAFT_22825 [Piptocephalis tieghemiana]
MSRRGYLNGLARIKKHLLVSTADLNTCLHFLVGHQKRNDASALMKKYPDIPRDLCTFNLLLALATRASASEAPALVSEIYGQILLGKYSPDTTTMNTLLNFFYNRQDWESLKRTHMDLLAHQVPPNEDTYVVVFRATARAKDQGWLGAVRRMWLAGTMAHRTSRTYTALLEAYAWVDPSSSAGTFFLMQSEGVEGNFKTHLAMLKAACMQDHVGEAIFWLRRCGLTEAPYLVLVEHLLRSNRYEEALLIRRDLEEKKIETSEAWSILWSQAFSKALAFNEADKEMERLLKLSADSVSPFLIRELIRYYIRIRRVGKADALMKTYAHEVNRLKKKGRVADGISHPEHDRVMSQAWTLLLASFSRRGYLKDAFRLWRNMCLSGGSGNPEMASALIRACGYAKRADRALEVWKELPSQGIPYTPALASSMLTALGRAETPGHLEEFWQHLQGIRNGEMSARLGAVWVAAWARCPGQWAKCLSQARKYEESMDSWAWDVVKTSIQKALEDGEVELEDQAVQALLRLHQAYLSANPRVESVWKKTLEKELSTITTDKVRRQLQKGPVLGLGGKPGWVRRLLGRSVF